MGKGLGHADEKVCFIICMVSIGFTPFATFVSWALTQPLQTKRQDGRRENEMLELKQSTCPKKLTFSSSNIFTRRLVFLIAVSH